MSALIQELIDKSDNFEVIRDQLGAILLVESLNQEALATTAGKDPALWRLSVYRERSEPWADFIDAPTTPPPPIVNVSWDNTTFDQQRSNAVERQRAVGIFHIDCYGYAISSAPDDPDDEGHNPGDEGAALEVARAIRLVRNILISGPYTYLAMQGVVGFRWPQTITAFQPQADGRAVQNVLAARIALEVQFNEFSPQAQGQPLELISAQVKRAETGQLLLSAEYPQETDP